MLSIVYLSVQLYSHLFYNGNKKLIASAYDKTPLANPLILNFVGGGIEQRHCLVHRVIFHRILPSVLYFYKKHKSYPVYKHFSSFSSVLVLYYLPETLLALLRVFQLSTLRAGYYTFQFVLLQPINQIHMYSRPYCCSSGFQSCL